MLETTRLHVERVGVSLRDREKRETLDHKRIKFFLFELCECVPPSLGQRSNPLRMPHWPPHHRTVPQRPLQQTQYWKAGLMSQVPGSRDNHLDYCTGLWTGIPASCPTSWFSTQQPEILFKQKSDCRSSVQNRPPLTLTSYATTLSSLTPLQPH